MQSREFEEKPNISEKNPKNRVTFARFVTLIGVAVCAQPTSCKMCRITKIWWKMGVFLAECRQKHAIMDDTGSRWTKDPTE